MNSYHEDGRPIHRINHSSHLNSKRVSLQKLQPQTSNEHSSHAKTTKVFSFDHSKIRPNKSELYSPLLDSCKGSTRDLHKKWKRFVDQQDNLIDSRTLFTRRKYNQKLAVSRPRFGKCHPLKSKYFEPTIDYRRLQDQSDSNDLCDTFMIKSAKIVQRCKTRQTSGRSKKYKLRAPSLSNSKNINLDLIECSDKQEYGSFLNGIMLSGKNYPPRSKIPQRPVGCFMP